MKIVALELCTLVIKLFLNLADKNSNHPNIFSKSLLLLP